MPTPPGPARTRQKTLGAFYTARHLAEAISAWGLRKPRAAVLDPSCGDGRFLEPATLCAVPRIVGCDVDPDALRSAHDRLGDRADLILADFFTLKPDAMEPVDLVLGNPPYIRYQSFRGATRRLALESALRLGVRLTGLTSSWAPFVLHAVQFLAPGGDLAMVVPAEILQTQYGLPTLRALTTQFASVTLLTCESNLFDEALEETVILLARDRGRSCAGAHLVSCKDRESLLHRIRQEGIETTQSGVLLAAGPRDRFAEALLLPEQRDAWLRAIGSDGVTEVGDLGIVSNGYVSGDNAFFHRTREQAGALGMPETWLRRAVRNSRSIRGLSFTRDDIEALEHEGFAHHLVVPEELLSAAPSPLHRFMREGQDGGTARRYKCRMRNPWWVVPGLVEADVLVAYMSGSRPRAAFNAARAVYTNSLHGIRLTPELRGETVAFALHSSLTLLSLEIEGRSYGGGILKLEPTEMRRARVVLPASRPRGLDDAIRSADRLLREGRYDDAVEIVDRCVLQGELGLTDGHVRLLREARLLLRTRRERRAK